MKQTDIIIIIMYKVYLIDDCIKNLTLHLPVQLILLNEQFKKSWEMVFSDSQYDDPPSLKSR